MQAVILAAGIGSRLRDFHALPKGFLKIGEQCLIEQSIQHLAHHGIFDILIITGYGFEHYNHLAGQYTFISTRHNPLFQTFGSLYSLYLAKDWVQNDVLILESDILYEGRALGSLINAHVPNAIITSGFTQSEDEVYVSAQHNKLMNMSKNAHVLLAGTIIGEFVGLTKLSLAAYQSLIARLDKNVELLQQGHYDEHGLIDLTAQWPIECIFLPDLLWAEVDNQAHFIRATKVFAAIQIKESA